MKILYIFPHPDDESFGVSHAMFNQRRNGHEVYLLTLTKGGATKQRHKYNYSVEEMGEVRYKELQNVAKTLDLNGLTVLDFPDSGLKELDPRELENVIRDEMKRIKPNVVVTYPVHGISGFQDHLVTHAVVKRVYSELKDQVSYLKRLAFHTADDETAARVGEKFPMANKVVSKAEEIDCIMHVDDQDVEAMNKGLDCYVTYKEVIEISDIKHVFGNLALFEIFQEDHNPPLSDLFEKLE